MATKVAFVPFLFSEIPKASVLLPIFEPAAKGIVTQSKGS